VEIEKLIGFFVNTLVLRTDLSGGPTFVELLKRVREVALGAYAHQEVPFEKLVEELQPERDLSRSPLFQVMFTLQNMEMKAVPSAGAGTREPTLNAVGARNETAKFDLSLSVVAEGAGIAGAVEYSTDLFDEVTIKRLVEHFQQLLSAVADDPRTQIGVLPLLSPAEQEQLLVEWNDTVLECPR
jgi:non-ribosomal peptide synthetase component F